MTQQKPTGTADARYKPRLFYYNGIEFKEVMGRVTKEYSPPAPTMRTNVNINLQSSGGIVNKGVNHYTTTIQFLFASKQEYADWTQYLSAEHKFYDEKGSIYVGSITGEMEILLEEAGTKYLVSVTLSLNRKQDFHNEYAHTFTDLDDHWAKTYITEMAQRGLIDTTTHDGHEMYYFNPEGKATRAHTAAFIARSFNYLDRILRGN